MLKFHIFDWLSLNPDYNPTYYYYNDSVLQDIYATALKMTDLLGLLHFNLLNYINPTLVESYLRQHSNFLGIEHRLQAKKLKICTN
jgi:hypothetical protein